MPDSRIQEYLRLKKVMDRYRELKVLLEVVRGPESDTTTEKREETKRTQGKKIGRRINYW